VINWKACERNVSWPDLMHLIGWSNKYHENNKIIGLRMKFEPDISRI